MLSYREIYVKLSEGRNYYSGLYKNREELRLMIQKRDRYLNITTLADLLLEHLRKDGVINLTREDIERKTGIPRRTIEEYLRTLRTRTRVPFKFRDGYQLLIRGSRNYSKI